jgi:lambda repressor-like predicted transcriptional regulator
MWQIAAGLSTARLSRGSELCWRGLKVMLQRYAHFRDRYRDMAKTLGFEGHIAWAEAMQ